VKFRLFNPSNQGTQFPAIVSRWLGHVKGFTRSVFFMSVFEYLLRLQVEAIASIVRVVRKNGYNHLGVIVRIDCLFAHKDVGISRVAGSLSFFKFLGLLGYL